MDQKEAPQSPQSEDASAPSPYKKEGNAKFAKYLVFWMIIFVAFFGAYQMGFDRGKYLVGQEAGGFIPMGESVVINKEPDGEYVDFALFWDVWELVQKKYVDNKDLDANEMLYGAIQGMLFATGDPYTSFLDPENNKAFHEDIAGSFEGIGAKVGMRQNLLTIVAPLDGSPAQKAGLRAGDKVLKIDGEDTIDMSLEKAVTRMRGPKDTQVELTIFRNNGDEETLDITITRGVIEVTSVELKEKEGFAHLKIRQFGEDTEEEFNAVVDTIVKESFDGIILDLRNNPGGYLEASIEMASRLLPEGNIVVIEEDHGGNQKKVTARGEDRLSSIEIVVLINEGSASASEILAGALRDNRENVTIIGMKSFGKGSVQEFIPLPRATAVKITVSKWLTPSGTQINQEGISPDIEVDRTTEDYDNDRDPQLDKAVEVLKEKLKME